MIITDLVANESHIEDLIELFKFYSSLTQSIVDELM